MSKTYRKYLYAGVAAAALLGAAPSAWAQVDVNQTSTNSADVTNNPSTISIGATGAAAATSVTGINTDFTIPAGGFGTITQAVTNNSNVTNVGGTITSTATGATTVGARGSLSVGASGAVASVSITGIGANFANTPAVGTIDQSSTPVLNTGIVSNTGSINQGTAGGTLALAGNAASVAVTAVGAQALASITGVDATGFAGTLFGAGGISQNVGNNADSTVTNTLSSGGITLDAVSGIGASVSASASGAVASVGITYINVGGAGWTPSTVGDISQTSTNADGSNVANNAISNPITVAGISGDGASVRASASGAIA